MTRARARIGVAVTVVAVGAFGAWGCGPAPEAGAPEVETVEVRRVDDALTHGMDRIRARADSMDEALRPLPLLRAGEKSDLQRFSNAEHVQRARRLGIAPVASAEEADSLATADRLVRLADSTEFWVVRELEHSLPLVTPDVPVLLEEIGRRFHDRLGDLGVPPVRLEVSSALRTPEAQADLRSTNPNATRGTSSHEFGTTVDVAYSGYRAPEPSGAPVRAAGLPALARALEDVEILAIERTAARRSRELKAILGQILREMQDEGMVLVTLEEQQPVYHMTVGRRLAEGS